MTKQATNLKQAKQNLIDRGFPVIEIGEYGYVSLKGVYGDDNHICEVARLSSSSNSSDNRSLIRFMERHRHSSPFEFCEMEFEVALPVFVERQMIRHRTANVQEVSARYSQLPSEVWMIPEDRLVKAPKEGQNRQGSGDFFPEEMHEYLLDKYEISTKLATDTYEEFMSDGMAPEIARAHLPLSIFTRKAWKCDIHNLKHFLSLRVDKHAQKEIRDYADAIFVFFKEKFPITCQAFEDYRLNAITLSAMEINIMKNYINPDILKVLDNSEVINQMGKTELTEFKAKLEKLLK